MARLRRFRIDSLENKAAGEIVALPESEAAHLRVLRLNSGAEIEVFDASGRSAKGTLIADARIQIAAIESPAAKELRLVLATAWPKGKRAAVMVEKCAELGLDV